MLSFSINKCLRGLRQVEITVIFISSNRPHFYASFNTQRQIFCQQTNTHTHFIQSNHFLNITLLQASIKEENQ